MSTGIHVTAHAIARYQERVEHCSKADAVDRLQHAVSISEPISGSAVHSNSKRRGKQPARQDNAWYRYCPVESLLLVLSAAGRTISLVTLFKIDQKVA